MKKATATSHGSNCLLASRGGWGGNTVIVEMVSCRVCRAGRWAEHIGKRGDGVRGRRPVWPHGMILLHRGM